MKTEWITQGFRNALLLLTILANGCENKEPSQPPAIMCPLFDIPGPQTGIRNLTKFSDGSFKYEECGNTGNPLCYLSSRNRVIIVPDLMITTPPINGVQFTTKETSHPYRDVVVSYTVTASWFTPDYPNGWRIEAAAHTWYNILATTLPGKTFVQSFTGTKEPCARILQFEIFQEPNESRPNIVTTLQKIDLVIN